MPDIWSIASIFAKFALYVGISGAVGLVMVRIAFTQLISTLETRLRTLSLGLALLALAAAVLGFMLRGAALTGGIGGMVDPEMLGLLWSTQVGDVLVYRLVGLGLIITGQFVPLIGAWISLAGGTLALWSFAQIGHIPELEQTGIRLLLLVHLLGITFWIGVLAPLHQLARHPDRLVTAATLGHRFGKVATVIVPILVLAGGVLGWLLLGSVSAIFTTAYGIALVSKVALVALLLGLGAANKLRFVPALQAGDRLAAKHLVRSIKLEIYVIAAILAVTATLTSVLTLPN